ncbi:hypothetical protein EVAR_46664_1 [Eumeta japonica]|uniref:Uncharacterized protein n=1 Tax=Eumeta variegata TaxID=151549 RepID=A0A4C1Y6I4_EUMVA|nr:hypothetical protein EVAR_46664_1 [Eumeta japonica]
MLPLKYLLEKEVGSGFSCQRFAVNGDQVYPKLISSQVSKAGGRATSRCRHACGPRMTRSGTHRALITLRFYLVSLHVQFFSGTATSISNSLESSKKGGDYEFLRKDV